MSPEDHIYRNMKAWLEARGWLVIAGEPPSGTNHLPVLEIRDPNYTGRGSTGSRKIDLLAYRDGRLLLIELKGKCSHKDVEKLDRIISTRESREALMDAIDEKSIPKRSQLDLERSLYVESPQLLIKSIGYNHRVHKIPADYVVFFFSSPEEGRPEIMFGTEIGQAVRNLFPED